MSDRVINPKDLPDLPALEAVQVSNTRTIAILGVMIIGYWGLLLPMFIWSILYLRKYLPDSALWLVGLFVATGCWGIFRLLTADHYFRVDRTGVSVRSALRRRRIEWAEVIGAEMREGSGSEAGIRLSTVDATLIIGSGLRYTECDRLLASIWQHLRQVGKAEHVRPTPRALSFWDTIPEGCPRELHWGKCPHPARWLLPMLMLAICVPTPLMLLLDPPKGWPGYVFFGLISLLALVMLVVVTREWGKEATRVVVRDDGLEAQTSIRSVYLPWSHADFAEWGQYQLAVGSRQHRVMVLVPYRAGDEDSERLILGIIRRLRAAGTSQAVVIPDALRSVASIAPRDASGSLEPTEVKLSRSDKVAILVLVGFFYTPVCIAIIQNLRSCWLAGVCAAVGAFVVGFGAWRICSSYSVRADDDGITRSFLGRQRLIRWSDVADYRPASYAGERMKGRKDLKNAKGKTLMQLPPGVGTVKERLELMAFVEAKLVELLPSHPSKPYLARPFSPTEQ